MDQNKRKQPRKSASVTTRISYQSSRTGDVETTVGKTKDLSRGGIQLEIPRLSEIEEIQEIALRIPGHSDPIKTKGEIQWSSAHEDTGCMGIRFTSLSSSQQQQIEDFLGDGGYNEIIKKANLLRFQEMKSHMKQITEPEDAKCDLLNTVSPEHVYDSADIVDLNAGELAELIAEHLEVKYVSELQPVNANTDRLPPQFCRSYQVIPVDSGGDLPELVLSNPFQHLFFSVFQKYYGGLLQSFSITEPDVISDVLEKKYENDQFIPGFTQMLTGPFIYNVGSVAKPDPIPFSLYKSTEEFDELEEWTEENKADTIDFILKHLLSSAIDEEQVDQIFLHPDNEKLTVRIDPEKAPVCELEIPEQLINGLFIRIKMLAGIDITDCWRPLEGRFRISCFDVEYTVHTEVQPGTGKRTASLRIIQD